MTQIVQAGVDLADAQGLEATSMRKIGEQLGVSPMALYTHVPSKEDLVALMVDSVYGELYSDKANATNTRTWRDGLQQVAMCNWGLLIRHPWLLDVYDLRSLLGPNASRKYETELKVLDGIGLSDLDMEASLTTLLNVVQGAARDQRSDFESENRSGLTDTEWWAIVAPALEHLMSENDYPVSDRVGSTLGELFDAARDSQRSFHTGLELVLAGIEALIRPPDGSPASPPSAS
ncbi:TetR/AcrR family transcriptional regulator [Nesterenkonia haasae]|uniref:TetR/AcrR family transcriptional regulator n=1 Tax=Nesterenkonia haasae TaxID=2587813 RepID=UPI001391BC07|nr:TetR/AcrR family transcriptional regulator [Nesterenkonia haasae]